MKNILPRYVLLADNTVLTVDDQDKLQILPVTVLRAEPKKVYISSGIADGARVITTTLDAPLPGTLLRINETNTGLDDSQAELVAGDDQL